MHSSGFQLEKRVNGLLVNETWIHLLKREKWYALRELNFTPLSALNSDLPLSNTQTDLWAIGMLYVNKFS